MSEINRIVRIRELTTIVSMSRSYIYELMSTGDFPQPVRLGPRAVGWRLSDVQAWIDSRQQAA